MTIKKIMEKSDYQSFDFLGDVRKGSDSGKKYELSKLEEYDLHGRACLDVGCNAGYFLFKLLNKNPKVLVGIDLGERFIDIANGLNKEHFKSDAISFIYGDFFSFDFGRKFDLIICFSTFHYFIGKQKDFLDRCHELLDGKGSLLLEVEEYPKNDVPEIDNTPRSADKGKYDYPNYLKMKEFVSDKFNILDRYKSVNIGGSLYDRYFYKLQKKYTMIPGMRPLEEKYKKTIIIVVGKAMVGKSTLCNSLLKDDMDYISADTACVQSDHGIREIYEFVEMLREEQPMRLRINDSNCELFVDYFFNKYIKRNTSLHILVDGYLFTLGNIYDVFLRKCKTYGYRVWKTVRVL